MVVRMHEIPDRQLPEALLRFKTNELAATFIEKIRPAIQRQNADEFLAVTHQRRQLIVAALSVRVLFLELLAAYDFGAQQLGVAPIMVAGDREGGEQSAVLIGRDRQDECRSHREYQEHLQRKHAADQLRRSRERAQTVGCQRDRHRCHQCRTEHRPTRWTLQCKHDQYRQNGKLQSRVKGRVRRHGTEDRNRHDDQQYIENCWSQPAPPDA